MSKDSIEPKPIHQITPEEIRRISRDNISIDTARKRIKKVRKALELDRKFITFHEYCEYFELPLNDVLKAVN